jgi:DNA invertase Pin-like site-specific DNA recombinase/peptidoglycan hydrolase-like protein with peptidoglycan-binding domain
VPDAPGTTLDEEKTMPRTHGGPLTRAGLAGLLAAAVLLALPVASSAAAPAQDARAGEGSLLQPGAGYAVPGGATRVRVLQRKLHSLGWQPGPVDGLYGPLTEAAVARFQQARGLAADGIVGRHTRKALKRAEREPLRRGAGYAQPNGSPRVRTLQDKLKRLGLRPGPVDGHFGPRTQAAVSRFERRRGLEPDGVADTRTRTVLAGGQNPPQPDRRPASQVVPDRLPQAVTPAQLAAQETNDDTGIEVPWLVLTALAALLGGGLIGVLIGRRRKAPQTDPAAAAKEEEVPLEEEQEVRALGYVSVPEVEELTRLSEQTTTIDSYCEQHGWDLLEVVRDVERSSTKGLERPGLQYALDQLERDEADCLVVSELGRLSRSVADLGRMLEWLDRSDGRLVAIDVGLDTEDPGGRVAARSLIAVSSWERERLAERTRKGLEAARARGRPTGRPAVGDVPALKERIVEMRASGMTLQAIADQLNDEGVPTLRGGAKWRPSSVQSAAGYRRPQRTPGAEGQHAQEDRAV